MKVLKNQRTRSQCGRIGNKESITVSRDTFVKLSLRFPFSNSIDKRQDLKGT